MTDESRERRLRIANPDGFHMRPMTEFVRLAQQAAAQVLLRKNDLQVDGKSPFDLLTLNAGLGEELVLTVVGANADGTISMLVDLLATHAIVDVTYPHSTGAAVRVVGDA